jgi:hypothetical protein
MNLRCGVTVVIGIIFCLSVTAPLVLLLKVSYPNVVFPPPIVFPPQ